MTVLVITIMAGDVPSSCQKCHFCVDTNTAAVTTAGNNPDNIKAVHCCDKHG